MSRRYSSSYTLLPKLMKALEELGPGDISNVNETVRQWNKQMQLKCAQKFEYGDKVWFWSRKHARITGTVIDISKKRIKVKELLDDKGSVFNGVVWKVSPSLLRKVGEK